MPGLKRFVASALIIAIFCLSRTSSAIAADMPGADKSARANELFTACLKEHPEYVSAIRFDLNDDGIDEMLVSEADKFPTRATLYVLSRDGSRLLNWQLFSRFWEYRYDSKSQSLITSTSGSGVAEYSMITLSGDTLVVRNIGKNLGSFDLGDRYYDYTETASDGENPYGKYSFGISYAPEGYWIPNMDILEGHAISKEEYDTWHEYFQYLELIELKPATEFAYWESSRTGQITQVSAGGYHTLALLDDGTVKVVGSNKDGQCEVNDWVAVKKVAAGIENSVALRKDGSAYAVGRNTEGQCNVEGWYGLTDIDTQHWHTIGLKHDGTVIAAGTDNYGANDVVGLKDIVAVSAGEYHNLCLDKFGCAQATGSNLYGESDVSKWTNLIAVDAGYNHSVGLRTDGTVVATGLNSSGQCDVTEWNNIIAISAGGKHTVGLRSDGTVIAVGSNEFGQCNVSNWRNVVWISAGYSATIAVTAGGEVLATGWNEYGQCRVDELTSG